MLFRLVYLSVVNVFAVLRQLPGNDRDKDAEILALRHQLAVVEHQLGGQKIRFQPADRVLLAALLRHLPRPHSRDLTLLVRPNTILRRHRNLIARRHATASHPGVADHPRPGRSDPGVTPGRGQPHAGLPAHPRRTRRPGSSRRCVDGLGDSPRGGHRPCPRTVRHNMGGLPALPGRSPAGGRLHRDGDLDRDPDVHPRGHRARHPPGTGPRCDRAPHLDAGHPGRPQPGHGSARHQLPSEVPDPGPGRRCSTPSSPTPASGSCSAGSGYPG
jgi:hypothetical protein